MAAFADVFQFVLEQRDAITHSAAINFELGFAGAAAADAAHQPGHLGAAAGQSRQQVFQLRQLDLNAPFGGLRALGENVQNQLGAVENFQVGGLVDGAHLRGREFAVEDNHVSAELQAANDDVVELALAGERFRIERRAALNDLVEYGQAAGNRQLAQFIHRIARIGHRRGGHADQNRAVAVVGSAARAPIARHLFFERCNQLNEIYVEMTWKLRVEKSEGLHLAIFISG